MACSFLCLVSWFLALCGVLASTPDITNDTPVCIAFLTQVWFTSGSQMHAEASRQFWWLEVPWRSARMPPGEFTRATESFWPGLGPGGFLEALSSQSQLLFGPQISKKQWQNAGTGNGDQQVRAELRLGWEACAGESHTAGTALESGVDALLLGSCPGSIKAGCAANGGQNEIESCGVCGRNTLTPSWIGCASAFGRPPASRRGSRQLLASAWARSVGGYPWREACAVQDSIRLEPNGDQQECTKLAVLRPRSRGLTYSYAGCSTEGNIKTQDRYSKLPQFWQMHGEALGGDC